MPSFAIYGMVVAAAVFFVGFITGMGGSLIPNAIFSLAMGVLAAGAFYLVQRYGGRKGDRL